MSTAGFAVACFNQAPHIAGCLESILAQTQRPDRVIVVDDGSADGSQEIIRSFSARGVELLETDRLGPSGAFNAGVDAIGTDVVAILGGDDEALPHRLSRQLELLGRFDVDLILGLPIPIDADDNLRSDDLCPEFLPHGGGHILRQLFNRGNFLCAPTATFTRQTYLDLGGFHPGLLQLQDFDLWVKWAARRRLAFVDERFILYRKAPGSLSGASNDRRMHAERMWVYRHFFDDTPNSVIIGAFPADLHRVGAAERFDRPLDICLLYLLHGDPLVRQVGLEFLLDLCGDGAGRDMLAVRGIGLQDLYDLTGDGDIRRQKWAETLLRDLVQVRSGI
jgi:hypothetical protein